MTLPAVFSQAVPAHLKSISAAEIAKLNADAARGASNGVVVNEIRLKGSKFRLNIDGKETRVLEKNSMELVIVHANPGIAKTFYLKKYDPEEGGAPDCRSADGITPHGEVVSPQSATCATCPQNEWGSKINALNGKKIKACADGKRMAVLPPNRLDGDMFRLSVPPASLADWGAYVKSLNQVSPPVPYMAVVTKVSFDTDASFPKLVFEPVRYLTGEEFAAVMARFESDEAKLVADLDNGTPAAEAAPVKAVATTKAEPEKADDWGDETKAEPVKQEAPKTAKATKAKATPVQTAAPVDSGWGDDAPAAPVKQETPAFDNSGTGATAPTTVASGENLDDVFGGAWD